MKHVLYRRADVHFAGTCVSPRIRVFAGAPRGRPLHATGNIMRTAPLIALIAAISSQAADAREIRRDAIPEAFWGTWASGQDGCADAAKPSIALAAKSYAGPTGRCDVDYVTEIPGRGGAIYSARMHCGGVQSPNKKVANLIIRPGTGEEISLGPTFESLAVHRRCPEAKQAK